MPQGGVSGVSIVGVKHLAHSLTPWPLDQTKGLFLSSLTNLTGPKLNLKIKTERIERPTLSVHFVSLANSFFGTIFKPFENPILNKTKKALPAC